MIGFELSKNKIVNSAISDLIGGVTNGIVFSKEHKLYQHYPLYWNVDTLKAEATAHFFEVIGSGGNRLRTFKTTFPCLYIYLLNKIR